MRMTEKMIAYKEFKGLVKKHKKLKAMFHRNCKWKAKDYMCDLDNSDVIHCDKAGFKDCPFIKVVEDVN